GGGGGGGGGGAGSSAEANKDERTAALSTYSSSWLLSASHEEEDEAADGEEEDDGDNDVEDDEEDAGEEDEEGGAVHAADDERGDPARADFAGVPGAALHVTREPKRTRMRPFVTATHNAGAAPPDYVSAAQPPPPPPLGEGGVAGGSSETRKFNPSTPEGASLLPGGSGRAALGDAAFARQGGPVPYFRSSDSYPDDFGFGMAFVRKVYSIVCLQLFASALTGALMMSSTSFQVWAWNNPWALILSMIMTFVSLGLLFWKRHSVPANYALLAMFTFFESYMIGNTVAFFDSRLVLQVGLQDNGIAGSGAGVVGPLPAFELRRV
ncbi:MAG: hypothetical protein BJ554DRAFT_4887, partial [Olpidium bornovanus]